MMFGRGRSGSLLDHESQQNLRGHAADIGAFDVVIVDEASQSDLWALPAILRGKRILVVGDDKQVSPDGGFIESTRIQELLERVSCRPTLQG